MVSRSNYDKFPFVTVNPSSSECSLGWEGITARLRKLCDKPRTLICVECYPGCFVDEIFAELRSALKPALAIETATLLKNPSEIDAILEPYLGGDPVFGRMNGTVIEDFLDPELVAHAATAIANLERGLVLVVGTGASLVSPDPDVLVYADMARWEIQRRQRQNLVSNLGARNQAVGASLKYKRAFFVDWRAADRLKKQLLLSLNFLLDTNDSGCPKMIAGEALRAGLKRVVGQPFRVVPYFDPGPWGGHWMEEVCDLPKDQPNHAWCFDCVPEENSLLLAFGGHKVEIPAIDLVFSHPRELLGNAVHARFGTEFPIRFDFLDTMGGGNLSFQVHPLTEYIQDKFGMNYTQDESYYLLDAGEDGSVFLGLKDGVNQAVMLRDLRAALDGETYFDADKYVNKFPARKHDHFLIPAGTVHCSGKNSMVLEISATPYIFTFKLWDWGRLGLNGLPRPIHIDHGAANIQWCRTKAWAEKNAINRIESLGSGPGWREERTGLHEREFIETRRHWFTGAAPHNTEGGVNVLNLVQGHEAVVESPSAAFEPFVVHYAETFIVPACVGEYTIRPHGKHTGVEEYATIKAFVRTRA